MKQTISLSAVFMLLAAAAQAAGVGTTGASFLKIGVGARELALGSAASSLSEGAGAVNWNPARLAALKQRSLSASYNMLFLDESQGFVGYAAPLPEGMGVLGAGVNYLTVSDIEKRTGDTEAPISKFSNNNTAVTVSYARPGVMPGLAVGGSVKYISQKLDTQDDKALALDLGSSYALNERWTAAFTVQNLGGKIGPDKLPLLFKGGASAKLLGGKLTAAADLDWLANDERMYLDLGAEYALTSKFLFRAGYQAGRNEDELGGLTGLGAGLGLKLEAVSFDYAYVPFGDLGDTHRMTLNYSF